MTNAPETRKTHVIRILGTNKAGDVISSIWADVERMDEAKNAYQDEDGSWQGVVRRFKWSDDPDSDDFLEDGPTSRKIKIVKVCSPDETDLNDPEEWIPIPAIVHLRSKASDQGKMVRLINEELTDARIVENRRILHYSTNIDDDAQAAFDADETRKVYVVKADRYERDDSTKDDSQYVEHQVIKYLKQRVNHETKTGAGSDQGKQTKLLNQYLIDESDEAKLEELGENSVNPPYRLDPYQNIININFGLQCLVVFATYNDMAVELLKDSAEAKGEMTGGYCGVDSGLGTGTSDVVVQWGTGPGPDFAQIPPSSSHQTPSEPATAKKFKWALKAFKVPSTAGKWANVTGICDDTFSEQTNDLKDYGGDSQKFHDEHSYSKTLSTNGTVNCFVFPWTKDMDVDDIMQKCNDVIVVMDPDDPSSPSPSDKSMPDKCIFYSSTSPERTDTTNWTIRYHKHREDGDGSDLPNKMVQCYPTGPETEWTNYSIFDVRQWLDVGGCYVAFYVPIWADPYDIEIAGYTPFKFCGLAWTNGGPPEQDSNSGDEGDDQKNDRWQVGGYRLDRKGEKAIYSPPREWQNVLFAENEAEPPLISGDLASG